MEGRVFLANEIMLIFSSVFPAVAILEKKKALYMLRVMERIQFSEKEKCMNDQVIWTQHCQS